LQIESFILNLILYRTNVVARRFLPKQSPALRDISTQKEIAAPPKSKSGGSQRHQFMRLYGREKFNS